MAGALYCVVPGVKSAKAEKPQDRSGSRIGTGEGKERPQNRSALR